MGLIYLLEELSGKLVFCIGEYQFEGIRLIEYMELPWKNKNGMKEYNAPAPPISHSIL
jgi:hypothetical protein